MAPPGLALSAARLQQCRPSSVTRFLPPFHLCSYCRPLPHGIRAETAEVCLFTKDEPDLSAEQTESLYRKLLTQNGITTVSQVREIDDAVQYHCVFLVPVKRETAT